MKKYRVTITRSAQSDIADSFGWGRREWGAAAAKEWAAELRRTIKRRLTHHPLSCPLAPDRDLSEPDVRQLLVGRYRVLFEVVGDRSRVLGVRGPFTADINEGE